MQTLDRSATAYDRLSRLTDEYGENEARLQELRVLTRALRTLAVTYCKEEFAMEPMFNAIVQMTTAAGVERNRIYQEQHRLSDHMDTLNHQIQNGVFNESNSQA